MSAVPQLTVPEAEDNTIYRTEATPMESGTHMLVMASLVARLRMHFEQRPDVYAIGSVFLFHEKGNPDAKRCPDVMVIKGVPNTPERVSYLIWKEKVPPTVIFELTSKSTAAEDLGPKKEEYERIGVREYFLFDPHHEYLPRPLVGYRLVKVAENGNGNGDPLAVEVHLRYEELPPDAEGGLPSAELGLRLVPRGTDLELIDTITKVSLPAPNDLKRRADDEKRRADDEKRRADDEKRRADDEKRRADDERRLKELAEQQLAELRKLLAAQIPPSGGSQT